MNKLFKISFLLLLITLFGCQKHQTALPENPTSNRPVEIQTSETYLHPESTFRLPATVESFQRVSLTRFDKQGLDVGAGYKLQNDPCNLTVTIYLYPTPSMQLIGTDQDVINSIEASWLEQEYSTVKKQILYGYSGAQVITEQPTVDNGYTGHQGIFQFQNTKSVLKLYVVDHRWFVKHRYSYPSNCANKAEAALQTLENNIPPRS
ncbi:hypothetical protein [Kiloniella sp.]|uniref:hypothetical protein n=1 Tax=Kiloniella sp. TaxID=1938587 RepID=UPI003A91749E